MSHLLDSLTPNKDNAAQDIKVAQETLNTEAQGLLALKETIHEDFSKAVALIDHMRLQGKGRLAITGMGKSGHIARKISATMASTGTPSIFVHPGEASHGDLGMITTNDIVIAISNSGEAIELSDILAYCKRFAIPLIAITSKQNSSLGSHADIVLLLPPVAEACPNGLAPTTSTTMTMAIGDALAMALLKRLNLTAEQFKLFHPGGKLGKKLLHVFDLMEQGEELPIVSINAKMDEAILEMTQKNLGAVLVVEGNNILKGIITDGDLKRHMSPDILEKSVTDIMGTAPKTISKNLLAAEAVEIMMNKYDSPITSLLIVHEDTRELKGMLRLHTCLKEGVV